MVPINFLSSTVLEGNQGGQKHFTLGKSMETFLSPCLLLICGPGKVFKENLVYDFPRDQSETGWLSVKHQKNQNSSIYSGFKKILKTKEIKAMQTSFSLKKQHKRTLFHSFRL